MLRLARPEDEQALFPIYTHRLVERFLTFDGVDRQLFGGIFSTLLRDGDFFVYEVDGTILGFCKATRLPGRSRHVAHLGPLAVSPESQGHGYAVAMLRGVLAQLERDGVLRFELLVEADNSRGIAFYRKLGFEREGVQRKAYKRTTEGHYIDEVMMVKFAGALA
jgi:putative acetyltransferase